MNDSLSEIHGSKLDPQGAVHASGLVSLTSSFGLLGALAMVSKRPIKSAIQKYHNISQASAIEEHSGLLGESAWAWANLHLSYSFIFGFIVGHGKTTGIGNVIWTSLASDRAQRDTLANVLKCGYLTNHRTTKQLIWSLSVTNKLAVYRNDMVHSATMFLHDEDGLRTMPSISGTPLSRLMRLGETDTRKLLTHLRNDLVELSEYVDAVWRIGSGTKPGPSPRRPVQRTLQLLQDEASTKPRRKSRARR